MHNLNCDDGPNAAVVGPRDSSPECLHFPTRLDPWREMPSRRAGGRGDACQTDKISQSYDNESTLAVVMPEPPTASSQQVCAAGATAELAPRGAADAASIAAWSKRSAKCGRPAPRHGHLASKSALTKLDNQSPDGTVRGTPFQSAAAASDGERRSLGPASDCGQKQGRQTHLALGINLSTLVQQETNDFHPAVGGSMVEYRPARLRGNESGHTDDVDCRPRSGPSNTPCLPPFTSTHRVACVTLAGDGAHSPGQACEQRCPVHRWAWCVRPDRGAHTRSADTSPCLPIRAQVQEQADGTVNSFGRGREESGVASLRSVALLQPEQQRAVSPRHRNATERQTRTMDAQFLQLLNPLRVKLMPQLATGHCCGVGGPVCDVNLVLLSPRVERPPSDATTTPGPLCPTAGAGHPDPLASPPSGRALRPEPAWGLAGRIPFPPRACVPTSARAVPTT